MSIPATISSKNADVDVSKRSPEACAETLRSGGTAILKRGEPPSVPADTPQAPGIERSNSERNIRHSLRGTVKMSWYRAKKRVKEAGLLGLIGLEAYGVWDSIYGPLAAQQWGSGQEITVEPGQTVPIDGGTYYLEYINKFGSQYNLGFGSTGTGPSYLDLLAGQSYIRAGDNLALPPEKITVLGPAVNGGVNILVQASQSWLLQNVVGTVSIIALAFTGAVALLYVVKNYL